LVNNNSVLAIKTGGADFLKLFSSPFMNEAGCIFRRELWKVSVRMKGILCYLSWHYTWVSVIVLGLVGTVLILIFCSIFRWNYYDPWNWKKRAGIRIVMFWITLSVARLLLRGYK